MSWDLQGGFMPKCWAMANCYWLLHRAKDSDALSNTLLLACILVRYVLTPCNKNT
jgi:hypothetical protein